MKTSSSTDRIEKWLVVFLIGTAAARLSSLAIFDTLFVVAGFSMILFYSLRIFISLRHWNSDRMETISSILLFIFALLGMASLTALHAFLPAAESLWKLSLGFALLVAVVTSLVFWLNNKENSMRWRAWAKSAFLRFFLILFCLLISLGIGWDMLFKTYFPERYMKQESYVDYYPENGAKKSEGYLLNGKADSLWIFYSPNGDTLGKEMIGE